MLLNIPGWDWRRDDQAVCLNEVKYGLLAQVRSLTLTITITAGTDNHPPVHPGPRLLHHGQQRGDQQHEGDQPGDAEVGCQDIKL